MPIRLVDLLAERGRMAAHREFLVDARNNRVIDYGAMALAVGCWARELDALGIAPGERVLVDIDDVLAFSVVHLALIAAGRCSAPIDPAAPAAEVERAARAIRPRLVVTDRDGRRGHRVLAGSGLPATPVAAPDAPQPAPTTPGSSALLTSGSTGAPKTVELSESQLMHVAGAVASHHRFDVDDRGFNPLPLFHINAQVVGLLATARSGASLVLDRRFHRTDFWQLLVNHDVTWLNAVPAILSVLAKGLAAGEQAMVPPRMRFIRSASAPLSVAVQTSIVSHTGLPLVESYGMTEAASQITATPLDAPARPGSVGLPVEVELDVIDGEGNSCPPGVVGRVRIRGEGVIRSYADGAGSANFDSSHWLDTADLGHRDSDGHLYLAGRADDVINRGGELVYPREIEEVLLGADAVVEAVVVGRQHDILGSVPVACIRTTGELDDTAVAALVELLESRCRQRLARYKRPAEVIVMGAFPLGPTGKVRRRELRRQVAEQWGSESRLS